MRNNKIKFTTLLLLAFISCNSPLNRKFNKDTFQKDFQEIGDSKKISQEDGKILFGYILMSGIAGKNFEGKTYSDILKEAKDYKLEQEELAAKAKKDKEEKAARLNAVLGVEMYDKGYFKEDYAEYLQYGIAFQNKTDREIRAVKGTLTITDLFDTEIKSLNVVEDGGIPIGQVIKKVYSGQYNPYIADDKKLAEKEMKDIKIIWTPEKIIFADGSMME
jgi:hypothetical protein